MKSNAQDKMKALMKDMIENTDYECCMDKLIHEKVKAPINVTKRRKTRFVKVAGLIFAVFLLSSAMTIAVNSQFASAAKFKVDNFIFDIKNGFASSDLQFNQTSMKSELVIENESQIKLGKNYLPELKIPGYIPEDYMFSYLEIKNNPRNNYTVLYIYEKSPKESIMIMQTRRDDNSGKANLVGVKEDFYVEDKHVFYIPNPLSEQKALYVLAGLENIHIDAPLEKNELVKILSGLQ